MVRSADATALFAVQVTTFKGHWAGGQFIIGRIITGIGNGMVRIFLLATKALVPTARLAHEGTLLL